MLYFICLYTPYILFIIIIFIFKDKRSVTTLQPPPPLALREVEKRYCNVTEALHYIKVIRERLIDVLVISIRERLIEQNGISIRERLIEQNGIRLSLTSGKAAFIVMSILTIITAKGAKCLNLT